MPAGKSYGGHSGQESGYESGPRQIPNFPLLSRWVNSQGVCAGLIQFRGIARRHCVEPVTYKITTRIKAVYW